MSVLLSQQLYLGKKCTHILERLPKFDYENLGCLL